jgi:hypothetical protein
MTEKSKAANALFISYRRDDSDAAAGRIRDWLRLKRPGWKVFFDTSSIDVGADFRSAIETAIAKSRTMLVIIGKAWLGQVNGSENKRINEADDVVRFEVATALSNGLLVIPVLINDTKMPAKTDLPADIQPVTGRNAITIRQAHFDDDFANLLAAIERKGKGELAPRPVIARVSWMMAVATGAFVALAALLVALAILFAVTSLPVGHWIGNDGVILLLVVTAAAGGFLGNSVWKRRDWRSRL